MKDTHKMILGVFIMLLLVVAVAILLIPLLDKMNKTSGIDSDDDGPDLFDPSSVHSGNALDYLDRINNDSDG